MKIIGIGSVHKYHCCAGCKKIENFNESQVAVTCTACNLMEKSSKVSKQWVVKLLVDHKQNSSHFQADDHTRLARKCQQGTVTSVYDAQNNAIIELL